MRHITRRSLGSVLLVASLTCTGFVVAEQGQSQHSKGTQSTVPQQTNPSGEQLEQLETRVKDLQVAIDNLQTIRAQDRENLDEAVRGVGRDEKQIDKLSQQVSKIMSDMDRVKTKVGLY